MPPLAVLRRVSDDEPRPIREINPEIPGWLEAIVVRLHAKDPAGRFSSASELAGLLGRCLAHVQQPLAVPLPTELVPPVRPTRRRLRWAGAGLLGFAAVLAGVAFIVPRRPPVPSESIPSGGDARQGTATSVLTQAVPDEFDQALRQAQVQAGAIEAELHRRADPSGIDAISELARGLADRAGALERELVSGRDAAPIVPTVSRPSQPR